MKVMIKNFFKNYIFLAVFILPNSFVAFAQTPNTLTEKEKQEGWQLLFDGETFSGLKRLTGSGWSIEDGELKAQTKDEEEHQQKDIITEGLFQDFELTFEFKIFNMTNSGVKYVVTNDYSGREGEYLGLEYQILDNVNFKYPERGELRSLASLYDLIPADKKKPVPLDEWNTARIIVDGTYIEHWLNGEKTVEYDRNSERFRSLVQVSKYKELKNFGQAKEGHILFQNEGSPVAFRSIKIKPGEKRLFPKKPGLVSYTHRTSFEKNVSATLDTIQSLGITDMEFSNLFGETPENLRKMLDERGIECSSFGVGYDDLVSDPDEVARKAKVLGASFVRVAWIPHDGIFNIKDAQKAIAEFNRVGEILKKQYGLTFCYHNHGYEFEKYEKGTLFDYMVQNTNPEFVSYEMDILWAFFPGQNPAELLSKYGKRFKLMHLKDLRKGVKGDMTGSTSQENDVALGTGQIDIPSILKAAQEAGIQHYYIEDESKLKSEQVPQTISYLKSLIE
jgi:sugar phosphate isomerase/epimerase